MCVVHFPLKTETILKADCTPENLTYTPQLIMAKWLIAREVQSGFFSILLLSLICHSEWVLYSILNSLSYYQIIATALIILVTYIARLSDLLIVLTWKMVGLY